MDQVRPPGADLVVGILEASGQSAADMGQNDGIAGPTIDVDSGENLIAGVTRLSVPEAGSIADSNGIAGASITAGNDDDIIAGLSFAEGGSGTDVTASAGISGTSIDAGDGANIILGLAEISGSDLIEAHGSGIRCGGFGNIETGDGEDQVIGIGASQALGGESYGIAGYNVYLGNDDDFVFARGATAGVFDVGMDGGSGDDIFDLHSGTTGSGGEIDGGDDDDLLILSGLKGDFAFSGGGDFVNITGDGTDLDVRNVEMFQFDDGTFEFDDLFPPT